VRYFVMTCVGVFPTAALGKGPDIDDAPWFHGGLIPAGFSQPLIYTLNPRRPGNLCAMYDDKAYPVMRDDLVEALQSVGVDNLQLFGAVIKDPSTGAEHTNYKAFNIVGVVSAANLEKSVLMGTSDSEMIDVDFESLAIDESKAQGHHLFRLAESVNAIIVDEIVKDAVEARGIPGMVFYDPEDWSG
jgi:uncharacterized protein DUF1629